MNVERLATLANFLNSFDETHQDTQFSLMQWMCSTKVKFKTKSVIIGYETLYEYLPNECNTVGCALGWAATIPEFKEAGLFLGSFSDDTNIPSIKYKKLGRLYSGQKAAEKFFGISEDMFFHFFMPYSYPQDQRRNPRVVATRILNAVNNRDTVVMSDE